ncbi:MAG: hypothetical protein NTY38_13785, partial [Acidobacteria bacterium]|nr:hypothetical protein [Acidobacteriota bacterium]
GQSTGLLALPEGRALMAYNQRKHGQPGVWIATASPSAGGFGLESNEIVWHAAVTTQGSSSGEHNEWTDFAFGEPSLTLLPDGIVQLTFWCAQPEGHGIQFVKLRRG